MNSKFKPLRPRLLLILPNAYARPRAGRWSAGPEVDIIGTLPWPRKLIIAVAGREIGAVPKVSRRHRGEQRADLHDKAASAAPKCDVQVVAKKARNVMCHRRQKSWNEVAR
jgi:hypothetical protein